MSLQRRRRVTARAAFLGLSCALLSTPLFADSPAPAASIALPRALPSAFVQSVFHIEKSENKNQVHYAVKVDERCRPAGKRPLYGYWRDFEDGPRAVSQLLDHELPAYGVSWPRSIQLEDDGGRVRIALRGFPDRLLTVETFRRGDACGARALTTIAGQPAMLTSIYVEIGFLFSVDYALVRGLRLSDGAPVQEKVE